LHLKKQTGLPWLADFRDPWTHIDYFKDLPLTPWALRRHRHWEHQVLTHADTVTAVSWTLAAELRQLGATHTEVVTNGFDENDFSETVAPDSCFSLVHTGSINADRNHPALWQAIAEAIVDQPELQRKLRLRLFGIIDHSITEALKAHGLLPYLEHRNYVSHQEVVREQQRAAVLLLLLNNTPNARGILTGKVFEYLASKRPILAVGPADGDVARLLDESKAGVVCDFTDRKKIKETLLAYWKRFCSRDLDVHPVQVHAFTRRALAGQMADLLHRMANSPSPVGKPR
ncbi:MAG: hypothetical protein NZM08_08445, partial [Chitinophagales bacterium]|nr:hypothetical protein [Chitinophagales bacterium]